MDLTKSCITLEDLAVISNGFDGFDESSMEELTRNVFYSPRRQTERPIGKVKQEEPIQFYGPHSLYFSGIEVRVKWSLNGYIYVPTIEILGAHSYQKEEFGEGTVMGTVARRISTDYKVLFTLDILKISEHLHRYRYHNPSPLKLENLAESIKTTVLNIKSSQEKLNELEETYPHALYPLGGK